MAVLSTLSRFYNIQKHVVRGLQMLRSSFVDVHLLLFGNVALLQEYVIPINNRINDVYLVTLTLSTKKWI